MPLCPHSNAEDRCPFCGSAGTGQALPANVNATLRPIPTGWLCPRCQHVNAPDVRQCTCAPLALGPLGPLMGVASA